MCQILKAEAIFLRDNCKAITAAVQIDPAKLQKWISFIMQILPGLLSLFSFSTPTPTPTPSPAPVQATPAPTSLDELFDHIEREVVRLKLTELQQSRLFNAIDAVSGLMF